MNTRTIIFLCVLLFLIGLIIGLTIKKPVEIIKNIVSTATVRDTIVKVQKDTIIIPVEKVKYFTKTDTVVLKKTLDTLSCVSFPLLMSDSSKISVTECSKKSIPQDLTFEAQYIDKRERIKIVEIEKIQVDTVRQKAKKMGFALGPSAGVGIDINNLSKPVYFIGLTLTYGLRF